MGVISKNRGKKRVCVAVSRPFRDIEIRVREYNESVDKSRTLIVYNRSNATSYLFFNYIDKIVYDLSNCEVPYREAREWVDHLKEEWKKDEDSITKPFNIKYKGSAHIM